MAPLAPSIAGSPIGWAAAGERELLPAVRLEELISRRLVELDGDKIRYLAPGFTDVLTDPEEKVRADLYLDLVALLGYADPAAIEMEKRHKVGHPHKKTDAKIDLLVHRLGSEGAEPFMLIELKSPDDYELYLESSLRTQLFNVAAIENQGHDTIRYLVYTTRWWEAGALNQKVVCVDYEKYKSFDAWDRAGRPNLRVASERFPSSEPPHQSQALRSVITPRSRRRAAGSAHPRKVGS